MPKNSSNNPPPSNTPSNNQDVITLLQQLQVQYPAALKRNYLFYGMLKIRGLFDEPKEGLPWLLASMIFIPITISLNQLIQRIAPQFDFFQATNFAMLSLLLIMMLYTPLIILQAKHSSRSIYDYLKNTPLKLTLLVAVHATNLLYIHSQILNYALFFFMLSFGFVQIYKENMFLEKTSAEQFFYLQQIRRACFWSKKQCFKQQLSLKLNRKDSENYMQHQQQLENFQRLHEKLFKYENKLCLRYKHHDLESYMDSIE